MKSFAGFLQFLVIRWQYECFVEVGAGSSSGVAKTTRIAAKRRTISKNPQERFCTTSNDILERLIGSQDVDDSSTGGNRGELI